MLLYYSTHFLVTRSIDGTRPHLHRLPHPFDLFFDLQGCPFVNLLKGVEKRVVHVAPLVLWLARQVLDLL